MVCLTFLAVFQRLCAKSDLFNVFRNVLVLSLPLRYKNMLGGLFLLKQVLYLPCRCAVVQLLLL